MVPAGDFAVMSGCAHPGCHSETGRGRVLCVAHWLQLPIEVKAAVRSRLREHNYDSARVVLHDFYSALYQGKAKTNGNHDTL